MTISSIARAAMFPARSDESRVDVKSFKRSMVAGSRGIHTADSRARTRRLLEEARRRAS
ncbi:MAG: hypothetical protein IPI32_15085 [Austwickia sp.]|nr:hypothetical protein [Austwickia sp.]MBK8435503.1 hypothetical protein [Austwickia sp.]MBK9100925.1 hypothetical protein [Austwickia sp.]